MEGVAEEQATPNRRAAVLCVTHRGGRMGPCDQTRVLAPVFPPPYFCFFH